MPPLHCRQVTGAQSELDFGKLFKCMKCDAKVVRSEVRIGNISFSSFQAPTLQHLKRLLASHDGEEVHSILTHTSTVLPHEWYPGEILNAVLMRIPILHTDV